MSHSMPPLGFEFEPGFPCRAASKWRGTRIGTPAPPRIRVPLASIGAPTAGNSEKGPATSTISILVVGGHRTFWVASTTRGHPKNPGSFDMALRKPIWAISTTLVLLGSFRCLLQENRQTKVLRLSQSQNRAQPEPVRAHRHTFKRQNTENRTPEKTRIENNP